MEELIKLVEKAGWKSEVSNCDEGELHIYPTDHEEGGYFYTVYLYPDAHYVYRSRFVHGGISDVKLSECQTFRDVVNIVKKDVEYIGDLGKTDDEPLSKEKVVEIMTEYLEMLESDRESFKHSSSHGFTLSKYSSNIISDFKELIEEVCNAEYKEK